RARDAAGNTAVSSITVTVTNPNDPSAVGQWSSVMDWPLVAINMILLDTGKILMWSGQQCIGGTSATIWDPATSTFTPVPLFGPQDGGVLFLHRCPRPPRRPRATSGWPRMQRPQLPGDRHLHALCPGDQPVAHRPGHALPPLVSHHYHHGGRPSDHHRRRRQ